MPVKNRHLFGWFKHPTHIGWHIYLPLLWHGTSVLFHGEIPHLGVKSLAFWPLKPPNFYIKPYQPSMLACFNSQFSIIIPTSSPHRCFIPCVPWTPHASARKPPPFSAETCWDARPVVAPWTARCPCERPPNTTMRGLGHSGVPWSDGFWSSMGAWQMTNMAMLPRFLHDFIRCVGWFEWRMELGFQWSVEWKYMGNIMTM